MLGWIIWFTARENWRLLFPFFPPEILHQMCCFSQYRCSTDILGFVNRFKLLGKDSSLVIIKLSFHNGNTWTFTKDLLFHLIERFRTHLKNKPFWTVIRNSCSGYKYSISAMRIAACCPGWQQPRLYQISLCTQVKPQLPLQLNLWPVTKAVSSLPFKTPSNI